MKSVLGNKGKVSKTLAAIKIARTLAGRQSKSLFQFDRETVTETNKETKPKVQYSDKSSASL
jgi:phage antirepressor YoqD-like protein